jgi:hypothetical protein
MTQIQQVGLEGFAFEDSQFTYNLAAGITSADKGKAMTLDTSAANTMKLAGDGDTVVGRLLTVENRINEGTLVGTVSLRFSARFTKEGTVAVGDKVLGSVTPGTVKAAGAANMNDNFVVQVDGDEVIVQKV